MMKGWQVATFFVEAGVSGSVPLAERPEGKRLLEVVKPGDVVITPKLDRMFRSARRSSLRTGSVAIPAGAEIDGGRPLAHKRKDHRQRRGHPCGVVLNLVKSAN